MNYKSYTNHPNPSFMKGGDSALEGIREHLLIT